MTGRQRVPATKRPANTRTKRDPADLHAALRTFIRTRGQDFLEDPNITSVGVGHKLVDGKSTGELAIQFTVGQKVQAEGLEALGTTPIPDYITVGGVQVPTDVLERQYSPAFRRVGEAVAPERKTRLDPVVPGISIGNVHATAGTIGCVVYDANDGTPYLLSNWHVLHTAAGKIGDDIVQPGPADDNRVSRNRVGKLVRSYLGPAGDCAVSTIEDRAFAAEIAEIAVIPDTLGEPELGDKVIKCGRTTDVTHGVVRRVDVIAKINYPGVGPKPVGGFEIGPDPDHLPTDGEVSAGGDSGAAWMFKSGNGKTSTVLAGLHFGGETAGSTDEHALACLPQSVFKKLGISLTVPAMDEQIAEAGEVVPVGYQPGFLGTTIPLPGVAASVRNDIAKSKDGAVVLNYTHFSLAMRRSRKFAAWVAWNIDGAALKRLPRTNLQFVKDPQLAADAQVGNELYADNRIDRGHIARRADLVWGSKPEAAAANKDSFFYTNIAPQMDDFNQSKRQGIWGRLEDAVFADVEIDDLKVSAFGGPVFSDDDRVYRNVKVPREFWKVLAFVVGGQLKSRGFLLSQNLEQLEVLELDEFRVFQVPLSEIQRRTGVRFPKALRDGDLDVGPEALALSSPLDSPADIQW